MLLSGWNRNLSRNAHRRGLLAGSARDRSHVLAEPEDLVKDHLAHLAHVLDHLEVEVEGRRAVGLIARIVPYLQVGVLERRLNADAARRVKGKHAVQQIQRVRVGGGEELGERLLGHEGQVPDVFLGSRGPYPRERLLIRCAQHVQDLVELVHVIPTLEEWPPT